MRKSAIVLMSLIVVLFIFNAYVIGNTNSSNFPTAGPFNGSYIGDNDAIMSKIRPEGGRSGIVGYWNFDEGIGDTIYDNSGNGNDGVVNGATWVEGISGSALEFDGIDDYVFVQDDSTLDVNDELTMIAWVYFEDSQFVGPILSKGTSTDDYAYYLARGSAYSNKADCQLRHVEGSWAELYSSQTLETGEWYNIALVRSDSTFTFYLNGIFDTTGQCFTGDIVQNSIDLYIGHHESYHYQGIIDEVSIYDKALTEPEILALYEQTTNSGVTINMVPNNPPVIVPAGGSFSFIGSLTNNTGSSQLVDVGVFLKGVPWGGWYGPIVVYHNIPLDPYEVYVDSNASQSIPGNAILGEYTYIAFCGEYPTTPYDSAWFDFTITSGFGSGSSEWEITGWFGDEENLIPQVTELIGNYPNPFNAMTNISFNLANSGEVDLSVYNLMGQTVEILINDRLEAGRHQVNWDASDYSSGVYFYKLTTDGKTFTKRMTLLK